MMKMRKRKVDMTSGNFTRTKDNAPTSTWKARSKIITLCGSVRFKEEFAFVNAELTRRGWIILAPGVFHHDILHKDQYNAEKTKTGLDKLHLEKIRMSDAVFIVDIMGYFGDSTKREISYAFKNKIRVFYWSKGDLWNL